jgi:hypothetical protein
MHYAVINDDIQVVRYLLEILGADPFVLNVYNELP